MEVTWNSTDNKYVSVFRNQDRSSRISYCVGTPSGTGTSRTTTWTDYAYLIDSTSYNNPDVEFSAASNRYLFTWINSSGHGQWQVWKTSGSGLTSDDSIQTWENSSNVESGGRIYPTLTEIASGKHLLIYPRANNAGTMLARQLTTSNLTADNFLGFADGNYTNGQTATVKILGNTVTKSSLTPGKRYYVSGDGSITLTEADPAVTAGLALSSTKLLIKPY